MTSSNGRPFLSAQGATPWPRYRGAAIAFGIGASAALFLGSLFIRPSYTASTTILVADKEIQTEWDLLQDESRDVDFEEQVRSRAVLEPVLGKLGGQLPTVAAGLKAFQERLSVERLRHSGVLRISVRASDPANAAAAANAVAASFITYRRTQAVERAERLMRTQADALRAVQEELNELVTLRNEVLVDETPLLELARQLAAGEARLSQVVSRYKADSLVVLQAQREQQALKRTVQAQTQARREALQQRLAQRHGLLRSVLTEHPGTGTVEALEASIAYAQRHYQELLDQQAKIRATLALWQQPSNAFERFAILDEALPPPPQSPSIGLVLALSAAALLTLTGCMAVPALLSRWPAGAPRRPGHPAHEPIGSAQPFQVP
ncbi:MAG: hypothetical protein HY353_02940 [Candidatus Omnitrophica bacterium]|nr:hypothetical protein [Candidatus Omnitrophota bacterium]